MLGNSFPSIPATTSWLPLVPCVAKVVLLLQGCCWPSSPFTSPTMENIRLGRGVLYSIATPPLHDGVCSVHQYRPSNSEIGSKSLAGIHGGVCLHHA